MYCAQAFKIFAIYHISLHCVACISHGEQTYAFHRYCPHWRVQPDSLTFRFGCDEDQGHTVALPLGLVVMRTEDSLTALPLCLVVIRTEDTL